jgi:hypothetical protein
VNWPKVPKPHIPFKLFPTAHGIADILARVESSDKKIILGQAGFYSTML